MSDPRAKAERSKAKDIRQGVIEQKPHSPKIKHKPGDLKPWQVLYLGRYFTHGSKPWAWAKFRTRLEAERYIEKESRSRTGAISGYLRLAYNGQFVGDASQGTKDSVENR